MQTAIILIPLTLCAAVAAFAHADTAVSCVDLQTRFDDVKASPKAGDTWVDLKSAFSGQQPATAEENNPQPGNMTVTYAGDGCTAVFVIQDGRVSSKNFQLQAPGLGVPRAQATLNASPEIAACITQIEAALGRLKAQTMELETMLAGLRDMVAHPPVQPEDAKRTGSATSPKARPAKRSSGSSPARR